MIYKLILWIGGVACLLVHFGCGSSSDPKEYAAFAVFQDCDTCPEMVVIPSGEFEMGSTFAERRAEIELDESLGIDLHQIRDTSVVPDDLFDEEPKHTVHIDRPFAIGKYVVTRSQFEEYIRDTGVAIDSCSVLANGEFVVVDSVNWRAPWFATSDLHPVVCVSWRDVQGYLRWLSDKTGHTYRLPSEAEWEYVAKAGTTSRRFFGDERDSICNYGNVLDLTFR
ncbi:MAG: formylglycine-generating enzyme family protein, partial [Saprospiraceae bacterium]|nr:formylglycine-generating enzyme family protein [Saprospiraceae bacterium]